MPIRNRLTRVLGIEHPILVAPMDLVSGGRLAAAVSHAGGLGLLGGGYGDSGWIEREWTNAGNAQIGYGFITWSLVKHPELLGGCAHSSTRCRHVVIRRSRPFAPVIHRAGVKLICQVQTVA
jgi:nitronate monooxygenase